MRSTRPRVAQARGMRKESKQFKRATHAAACVNLPRRSDENVVHMPASQEIQCPLVERLQRVVLPLLSVNRVVLESARQTKARDARGRECDHNEHSQDCLTHKMTKVHEHRIARRPISPRGVARPQLFRNAGLWGTHVFAMGDVITVPDHVPERGLRAWQALFAMLLRCLWHVRFHNHASHPAPK